MKKIIAIVLVLVIVVVAIVTCPDRQQHHDVLKGAMNDAMNEVIKGTVGADDSVFGFSLASIGTTLATKLIENVTESTLTVHDYIVLSTGEVTVAGKTKTVSIGAFGHVFPTFTSEDIKKAVDGNSEEKNDK